MDRGNPRDAGEWHACQRISPRGRPSGRLFLSDTFIRKCITCRAPLAKCLHRRSGRDALSVGMEPRKGRKMIWTLKRYWSGGGGSASVAAVASARCTRRYCAQTLLILERNIHMTEKSKNPAPDRAEWNAYFPSDYSLSVYTSPTTDFHGCGPPRPHPPDGRQPARLERARTACGGDPAEGSEITHKNISISLLLR